MMFFKMFRDGLSFEKKFRVKIVYIRAVVEWFFSKFHWLI